MGVLDYPTVRLLPCAVQSAFIWGNGDKEIADNSIISQNTHISDQELLDSDQELLEAIDGELSGFEVSVLSYFQLPTILS
jgi:hypothetical protein